MTPDQIIAVKRVLLMGQEELAELRRNLAMHDEAIDKLSALVGKSRRHSDLEALQNITDLHNEIDRVDKTPERA